MKYKPHDYQKYVIDYIIEHPIAAVWLSMGLGKTSCTLSAIEQLMYDSFEISKVLVIAPLRVAKVTWSDEIKKWDNFSHLRYSIAVGTEKERREALQADADIFIINRENLPWLVEKSHIPFEFDMIVIDELSSFKNWNAKRFKSLMQVRPRVKRIVGLTGTPSPNGLMDLFAEFKCLDMGKRLGRFITQYRNQFFIPDRMNGHIVYSYALRAGAEEEIYDRISDITISMKAMDHLNMPELVENRYPVYMSESEQHMYDSMKKDLLLPYKDQDNITAANAAALSGKLGQIASGCVYSESGEVCTIHSRKLDALEDIIEAAEDPLLLCYWYKHDLERITKRLDALNVTYDRISTEDSIRRWNEGKLKVGLIHPAAAGHGLNLQGPSHHMVWYSLTWSLELYQQTVARLWRQGQKSQTVVVQHIITAGTIDEDILRALTNKDAGQARLIDAVKAQL